MLWQELDFAAFTRYSFYVTAVLILVLDLIFGDPENFPHPVVLVGRITALLDRKLNRPLLSDRERYARGILLGAFLPALLSLCLYGFLLTFYRIHPLLYLVIRLFLGAQLLAVKSLAQEAEKVAEALRYEGLAKARKQLSRIVGRDTAELSAEEVIKATVETVSENFADGVVAPLFYFTLFDLPGMFFYKTVNTLDSMLGYHNARYEYFGRFSARLDDVLNLLPSRLAALLLWLACYLTGLNGRGAWRIYWRDRYAHLSPNSAHTEAVAAGALGLQLGGSHTYGGKTIAKPTIGDAKRLPDIADIDRVIRLHYVASFLALLLLLGLRYILERYL